MKIPGLLNQLPFSRQLESRWQRLYRLAYAWCHDTHLSADLVQESMVKALKNRHQLKDVEAFDGWLFRILSNTWRDYCRQSKDLLNIENIDLAHEAGPESEIEHLEVVIRVKKAIARLNQDQRQIVTLIDLEDLSYNEVAQILEIPIGTVMSRLCRARKILKQYLHDTDVLVNKSNARIRRVK